MSRGARYPQGQFTVTTTENPILDARRLSFNGPPFIDLFDPHSKVERLPRSPKVSPKKVNFLPPFFVLILGSTYLLVFLCILLIVPILQLVIGIIYRNQCPINPNIAIYLIVAGACGLGSIGLLIMIIASVICCSKQASIAGSLLSVCVIGLIWTIIFLLTLFLFIWFIIVSISKSMIICMNQCFKCVLKGNVWVFGARNSVNFDNLSSKYYCHPTLYQFAFWIIILSYILAVFSCCVSCCRACIQSLKSLRA